MVDMTNLYAGYCDYNATAPALPEVRAAMAEILADVGNPSSVHRFGRAAKRRLNEARQAVADLVATRASEVIFTSGGTEANNLVMAGVACASFIVSGLEHDSVLSAARAVAAATNRPFQAIPVRPDGQVDLLALEEALRIAPQPALVSVMFANNETGVLQPVEAVRDLARTYGALFHCDAVQAAGKFSLAVDQIGADMLSLSAHKIGGPQGIGALIVRDTLPIKALLHGGRQELERRGGTENLSGIYGFGAAAHIALQDIPKRAAKLEALRNRFEEGVRSIAGNAALIYGVESPRIPNTSCIGLPGVAAETQVIALDLAGLAVSAGSACSSGKVHPSHVLLAMGCSEQAAREAVRVSFGWASCEEDVDKLISAWGTIYRRAAGLPQAPVKG